MPRKPTLFGKLLLSALALLFGESLTAQTALDTVIFGDTASESVHAFESTLSESFTGNLSQPARRLLPKNPVEVNGGDMSVTMAVDPVRRNYFSVKLWGGDDTDDDIGRLYLYIPLNGVNYQVGYRHEGDYMPLSVAAGKPPLPGRFFYSTTLLPLWMTQGKTSLTLKIVSTGRLYGLGSGGPPTGTYQFNLTMNSRGVYRAYTHTEAILDPSGETQGAAPTTTTRPAVTESSVLGSSGTYTTGLNNWVNNKLAAAVTTFTATDVEMLAKAHVTPQVTAGYNNPAVIAKVVEALDGFATDYYANPSTSVTTSNYGGAGGNEVWGGRFGALGWAIHLLNTPLASSLDVSASYGTGGTRTRRSAWGDMLAASRDSGRLNRNNRYITNQALIADGNIYKANRGLLALADSRAFTDTAAQRYLRESCGLTPWLGSDLANGGSALKYGSDYYQVTPKGLSREWGYVGGYGEMQTYAATFYEWTGNTEFRDQAVKMIKARAPFRRPAIEVSGTSYYRVMERTGLISWRGVREVDGEFANDINYGDAVSWSSGARVAGQTLDPDAVGYAKQMLADNQFFNNLVADSRFYSSLTFDSRQAFEVWDDYNALKNAADSGARLPMTDGQPDFVWSDEQSGVIAIKRGAERLWIAPFYQAKTGTGINGIARFHRSTAQFDQYGVLETVPQFKSGSYYVRPNMVDKPESTGYTPPDNPSNAYAGEILPLGLAPGDAQDVTPFRGRVDFHAFRYGRYLVGMNASPTASFGLKVPTGFTSATDLVSGSSKTADSGEVTVPSASSVVFYLDSATDPAPVPIAPLCLTATGNSAPSVSLDWTPSSGAETYTIKRSTTPGGPYTDIEEATGITETGFVDTGVTAGTPYYYVVVASNTNGDSYFSTEASTSAGLPSPWNAADVGAVGTVGGTSLIDNTFTLTGAGTNVGGTADAFHFAYTTVNGDGTLIARLSSRAIGGTMDDKVGLMIRDGNGAGAIHFSVFIDALTVNGSANRARYGYRSSTNGNTAAGDSAVVTLPEWFKVQRSGNSFSGYYSNDGATWTLVGSTTLTMPGNAQFGMFVCSRDAAAVNTSVFDGVTAPGWVVTPAAPSTLSSNAGDESVGLTWSASPGAASYSVKRALVSEGPYTPIATGITETTYTNTGLTNNTTYFYVISAVNASGESPDSQETNATPLPLPPDPPTGLNSNAGNGFVSLSWNGSFGAATYNIKRSSTSGGPFVIVSTGVASTNWTDNNVVNGTPYFYVVTAVSVMGESINSPQVSATPSAVPQPPSSVSATSGNASVSLFWPQSYGATSYTLKRSTTSGGPYTVVASGITANSHTDSGLTNGTAYFYVLTSSNATGESANSDEASALPSTTLLPSPWSRMDIGAVGVSGSSAYNAGTFTTVASGTDIWGTEDQFHFIYQPTAGNCTIIARVTSLQNVNTWAKAGIMIRQSLDANSKNAFLSVTPTTTNGIRFQNRTSAGGTTAVSHSRTGNGSSIPRWLRLIRSGDVFTASRSSNGSTWTTMGSVTVSMTGPVYIGLAVTSHDNAQTASATFTNVSLTLSTPAVPTGLTASTANNQTTLSWTAVSGATGYNIKRSTTSGGPYTTIASGVTGTTHTDNSAVAGSIYYYVISAVNATGESGDSNQVGAVPNIIPPGAPTSLAANSGDSQAALTWASTPGASYYKLKRSLQSGGPYTVIASPLTHSFTDSGLTNGTIHYYVVSAVNSAGEGSDSTEVSVTPQLPAPGVPMNLIAASGDQKIMLSWSATAYATHYKVQRSSNSGGPYTEIATPTANFLTDTGLVNGTTYHYVVSAVNISGESANSAQATGTPLALASGTWANPVATAKPGVTTVAGDPNLTLTANTFAVGDLVQAAAAFSGFTSGRYYWVVSSTGLTIQLSATKGGIAITPTAAATTASAIKSSQLWNTATNWTGNVVASGVDSTATFPIGSPAADVAAVLVDADTTIGMLLYSNNSSVADFTLATGPDHTLGFAVSGPSMPMIEVTFASNRRLNLGERDNAVLKISGNQGLLIRSSAGGAVTDGIGSNPSKEVTVFNADWNAFSGGIVVDRGNLNAQLANRIPQQSLALGAEFSTTNDVLAGLTMSAGQTIDALNGNANGRVAGSQTLTVGAANGGGNFGGVFGQQFNGIRDATNLTKSGTGRQDMSGTMTGNGAVTVNGGILAFTGASTHHFSGAVTVNNGGSLLVDSTLAPVPPLTPITLAGTSGSTSFTSSVALKTGDQVRVTSVPNPSAGLTLATVYHVVNTPAASTTIQISATSGGTAFSATGTATHSSQLINATTGTSGRHLINSGATLGGTGTISPFDTAGGTTAAMSVSGTLSPGDPLANGGIGTLTLNGSSTVRPLGSFETGGVLNFQIGAGGGDLLAITGAQANDLAFNANTIHFIDATGGNLPTGEYTLVSSDAGGTYSGLTIDENGVITAGLAIGSGLESYSSKVLKQIGNAIVLSLVNPTPPAPATLAATAGEGQIALNWSASPSATSYAIKRSWIAGGPYDILANGITSTAYTDTAVSYGSTYHYIITAMNGAGESPNSPEASGTLVPMAATVTLGNLNQPHDGTPKPVTVTTEPAGLAVEITYNGSAAVPGEPGSHAVIATISNPAYAGSASGTLVIRPPVTAGELSSIRIEVHSPASVQMTTTVNGHFYQLQYSDTLAGNSWRNLGSAVPGTDGVVTFQDTTGDTTARRFYRVTVTP